MTEKAKKLWLEIGSKWNIITLGKNCDNYCRDMIIHSALYAFDLAAIVANNRKAALIGGIITSIVAIMEFAASDALNEEILETMRYEECVKDLDKLSKSIIVE